MGVEFRILGPLEADIDGEPASLGGRRQRAVLAILLSQANETVPVERLIDGVFRQSTGRAPPPPRARALSQQSRPHSRGT